MKNLNKFYKPNITDTSEDFYAYIDEAGTEGFDFDKSEKWFIVSAIFSTLQHFEGMLETLDEFINEHGSGTRIKKLSFKKMRHNKRKIILGMLSNRHEYMTIHSAFCKPEINPDNNLCEYPSMYFVGVKNLIERLTWATSQYKKRRINIYISTRNHIASSDLEQYLFTNSIKANKNLMYIDRLGKVALGTPNTNRKLLFADYTASSMFRCLNFTTEANVNEPIYFNIFQKNRLFSSNHEKYKGVWSNGFKCTPSKKELIEECGILEEGTHKN